MKNIHIILFFTLWVILGSCSTYYISNKQVMEVQQGMSRQNVEKTWVNRITDVLTEVARNGSTTGFLQCFTATRSRLLYILQMEELRVWIPLMVMKYFFRRLRL